MQNAGLIILLIIFPLNVWAEIEIYAGGEKYDSLESYHVLQDAKQAELKAKSKTAPLSDEQKVLMVEQAKKLGVDVDLAKLKTIDISPLNLQDKNAIRKLRLISIDPLNQAKLLAHPQTWRRSKPFLVRQIKSENLEEALRQAVGQSNSAKMIVTQDNTVKVLTLTPNASSQTPNN